MSSRDAFDFAPESALMIVRDLMSCKRSVVCIDRVRQRSFAAAGSKVGKATKRGECMSI